MRVLAVKEFPFNRHDQSFESDKLLQVLKWTSVEGTKAGKVSVSGGTRKYSSRR